VIDEHGGEPGIRPATWRPLVNTGHQADFRVRQYGRATCGQISPDATRISLSAITKVSCLATAIMFSRLLTL